jgi:hypothetical protein
VYAGHKFYEWLSSWNWDLSYNWEGDLKQKCMDRYFANINRWGYWNVRIDACACDVIVTDCHLNAESPGSGPPENSGPFNVQNGVSSSAGRWAYPSKYTKINSTWWDAGDFFMPDTVGCVGFGTSGLCCLQAMSIAPHGLSISRAVSCCCFHFKSAFFPEVARWKQVLISRALQRQIWLKLL